MCTKSTKEKQKCVVVLGSPRSGTSMISGLLSILGVDMGNIRQPDPENPTGYFEDKDFLSITDDIFEAAEPGSDGFHPPCRKKILAVKQNFDNRISTLINHSLSNTKSQIWGWKTTGTCLTIELFLPHLVDPCFVIVLRNPLDIARSAIKYTKAKPYKELNLLEGLEVANLHYRHIYAFFENHSNLPVCYVSFDDVVRNPVKELTALAKFLGLRTMRKQFREARNFVASSAKIKRIKVKARMKAYFEKRVVNSIKKCIRNTIKIHSYCSNYIRAKIRRIATRKMQ